MDQVIVPLKRNVTSFLVAVAVTVVVVVVVVVKVEVVVLIVIVVYSQELKYENVTTVLERYHCELKLEVTKQASVGVICKFPERLLQQIE